MMRIKAKTLRPALVGYTCAGTVERLVLRCFAHLGPEAGCDRQISLVSTSVIRHSPPPARLVETSSLREVNFDIQP